MAERDFFKYRKRYQRELKLLEEADIHPNNKRLIKEFDRACRAGTFGKKLDYPSAQEQLNTLRRFCQFFKKDLYWATQQDFDEAFAKIEEHFEKLRRERRKRGLDEKISGDWAIYRFKVTVKKFMRWLRWAYWYPEGYPGKEKLDSAELFWKTGFARRKNPLYPLEVAHIYAETPKSELRDRSLPPWREIGKIWDKLASAAANLRDKAIFKCQKKKGLRIGGLGSMLFGDLEELDIGYKFYIRDKNRENVVATPIYDDLEDIEAIRAYLLEREAMLRDWGYDPYDPKLPLWLKYNQNKPVMIDYQDIRNAIKRAKDRWNKLHPEDPITYRLYNHLTRFYAEGVDQKIKKIPDNIRRKERGWSPTSPMPGKYGAMIEDVDIEEFYEEKAGIKKTEEQKKKKKCFRCGFINDPHLEKCFRCGTWLDPKKVLELESRKVAALERRMELLEQVVRMLAGDNIEAVVSSGGQPPKL